MGFIIVISAVIIFIALFLVDQYKVYEESIAIRAKISPEDLLEMVKEECKRNGVEFITSDEARVPYPEFPDIKVSGYFVDAPKPALACALGKPKEEWLKILIHEFQHMRQWAENSEIWKKQYANGINCDKGMDEWLTGKEYTKEEYTYFIRTMQELELDCEKRTAEFINAEKLPLDPHEYVKKANAYIFLYSVLLETKKWPDVAPYEVKEIVDLMPTFFFKDTEVYHSVNENLMKLYKEKCYETN